MGFGVTFKDPKWLPDMHLRPATTKIDCQTEALKAPLQWVGDPLDALLQTVTGWTDAEMAAFRLAAASQLY